MKEQFQREVVEEVVTRINVLYSCSLKKKSDFAITASMIGEEEVGEEEMV